jgi:hypothetical protein
MTAIDFARCGAGTSARPDELRGEPDRGQRVAELVRQHREELVLAAARLLQLGRALGDPQFEVAVQALELACLAMQLDEDPHLGAQDFRHDGHRDVVDGAVLVALEPVELGERDAGDKDDRGLSKARVLAHHRRQLEAVELGHDHVDQHDRELRPQEMLQRLPC